MFVKWSSGRRNDNLLGFGVPEHKICQDTSVNRMADENIEKKPQVSSSLQVKIWGFIQGIIPLIIIDIFRKKNVKFNVRNLAVYC